jgi:small subunit ribosomal protein S9
MAEKKITKKKTETKKPVKKPSLKVKKEKKEVELGKEKKEIKEIKKEKKEVAVKGKKKEVEDTKNDKKVETIKINNAEFGLPERISDDDFVLNEDDFKNLDDRYFEGTGRRKTSVARVRLYTKGDKDIIVNGEDFKKHFITHFLQITVLDSLDKMKSLGRFRVTVVVKGGGINSQAEAVRHGIARALVVFNPDYRKRLRKAGFLTRDPRMKERKKFGLRRARKAPQWSKR